MMMYNYIFWICLCISIMLLIGGFFAPPTGVIDGSVLTAVGELFGFAALGTLPSMLKDHDVTLTHGNTSLTVESNEEDDPCQKTQD